MSWPLFAVEVAGRSMHPTYAPGDWLLCRRTRRAAVGAVIVIERAGVGLVVKRVSQVGPDGALWLLGDSADPAASTDSRTWGWVSGDDLRGRVLLRYRRGAPRRG